jgi:hypothetical protein
VGGKDYEDEFISKTLDHTLWIEKADHLLEVASFIEPRIEEMWREALQNGGGFLKEKEHYISTYFMLVSYALENLLKALYIKLNKDAVKKELEEKKQLPKKIAGHDLYRMAKELNVVNLEYGEESLLKKVSRSAVWFGRYPTPITASKLDRFAKSEFENLRIPFRLYTSDDPKEIKSIISRVRHKLKSD